MGSSPSCSMESVIVVMDANRNRGNVDALDWALNRVVRPNDNVIVIGIICEFGKKTSCFPFYMGIGISAMCKLFSMQLILFGLDWLSFLLL